jgi:hypothetical protein
MLAAALARAFQAGEQTAEGVVSRAIATLGRSWRWVPPLARRYLQAYNGRTTPRHKEVARFLLHDRGFRRARSKYSHELAIAERPAGPHFMRPVEAARAWDVPAILSAGDLAAWLSMDPSSVDWLADLKGLSYKGIGGPRLAHYQYRVLSKKSGGIRLIESPKQRLKEIQRRILSLILDRIPSHRAAHGFMKGRSIKTFSSPHAGQPVVLRMDLQDFFLCISGARIQTLFRTVGYPEPVADLLGGICTNATPRRVWNECAGEIETNRLWDTRAQYARPHLPQGAPTSPALANLCAYKMDCRLAGLAKSVGAEYTRYADDLAFSGAEEFNRCVERFSTHVAVILQEEGFRVNHRKTRVMRRGVRQHLAGLVINRHPNVRRADFDLLKATLTNCVRMGPASQNHEKHPSFQAHLEGRVGFVESINPGKGMRLREILDRIVWPAV